MNFKPSNSNSEKLQSLNLNDIKRRSHNCITDQIWSNSLTCIRLVSIKRKLTNCNLGFKSRSKGISKIIRKSRKSWRPSKIIYKLTKTLSYNFNKKITNSIKIFTYLLMHYKNSNCNSTKQKGTSNKLNINSDSLKVKEILTPMNSMKKTLLKDNSNINSKKSWTNFTMSHNKKESESKKIFP